MLQDEPQYHEQAFHAGVVMTASAQAAPTLDSKTLLQGGNEVRILHGAEVYRLRHTRNDKLILTK